MVFVFESNEILYVARIRYLFRSDSNICLMKSQTCIPDINQMNIFGNINITEVIKHLILSIK